MRHPHFASLAATAFHARMRAAHEARKNQPSPISLDEHDLDWRDMAPLLLHALAKEAARREENARKVFATVLGWRQS